MRALAGLLVLWSCAPSVGSLPILGDGGVVAAGEPFGPVHEGSYHLGPVDWSESAWTNSCSPYPADVQQMEGVLLAGVDRSLNGDGSLCDVCALVTTRLGRTAVVRIITTGVSNSAGDMDLSPEAYNTLFQADSQGTSANPRPMHWQLTPCPTPAGLMVQFQTQANTDWTSFWLRNLRVPLSKVEVKSAHHADFVALRRETDGTWNDDRGFGPGASTLRLTSSTGASTTLVLEAFTPGQLVRTNLQWP